MIRIAIIMLILSGFSTTIRAQEIVLKKTLHRHYNISEKHINYNSEEINSVNSLRDFAFECIILDHVNTPIGFDLINQEKEIIFQYFNDSIVAADKKMPVANSVQKYWHHFVINFMQGEISVFDNNILIGKTKLNSEKPFHFFTLIGLLENEKYMQLNDLLKEYTFYDSPLSEKKISENFIAFTNALKNGSLSAAKPELIVEPFLSLPTKNMVILCWETNRPSTGKIKYGASYPLLNEILITEGKTIQNLQISHLEQGTNYYLEAEVSVSEEIISTTKLSFKTAQTDDQAFRFAIIGDTESRPFVNAQIARNIWENRPDFFLLLGDITDGGHKNFKDQWTFEFFTGTNALMQRVPIIPVAGNGDADLHWFNKYFNLPSKEGFYKYSWSNADFFVLNSYKKEELVPGGKQYNWLEKELQQSIARWKIVALHYAPYSSDENDYGNSWEGPSDLGDKEIRKIVPLVEKYNVDFVTYGHLHCYERSWPVRNNTIDEQTGTVYFIAGGAGGNLENFAPHRTWFSAKTFRGYHYLIANINKNHCRIDTYNSDGYLIDSYEKQK